MLRNIYSPPELMSYQPTKNESSSCKTLINLNHNSGFIIKIILDDDNQHIFRSNEEITGLVVKISLKQE